MGVGGDTIYLKIERNIVVTDRHVTLQNIAKLTGKNTAMLRQLKQMKVYSFDAAISGKQVQVFSVMKIIEKILQEYPQAEVNNIGEKDFVLEYEPDSSGLKWGEIAKVTGISLVVFFGAAFSIMAFNNDVSVTDLFGKLYQQVTGTQSSGCTELEICYSIGLAIGVVIFFNHLGKKKITKDPTPVQVQMRKYETDVDTTFVENAGRGGKAVDVD